MYFLLFSKKKKMKFKKKNVTDKNTNFSAKSVFVTNGSCDIFKYHYEIFICEIYVCSRDRYI